MGVRVDCSRKSRTRRSTLTVPEIAAVLLAAGAATRFGKPKQLALLKDGRTLIKRAIDAGTEVAGDHLYVVLGAHREVIEPTLTGIKIIFNPNWEAGLGTSIACAASYMKSLDYDGVLFYLADQAGLTARHLAQLWRAFDPERIVCADYGMANGERILGVPALFPTQTLSALSVLQGDSGARKLLRSNLTGVHGIPMSAAALDIDTVEDLAAFTHGVHQTLFS